MNQDSASASTVHTAPVPTREASGMRWVVESDLFLSLTKRQISRYIWNRTSIN